MKRDLHLEEPLQSHPRSASPSRRESGDGQPAPASLDALSAAGDKFSDFGSTRSPGIRRPSLALMLLCGLSVGGAAFFLQPARHRIEATLRMSGETDAAGTAEMAQQLREFLHRHHANAPRPVEGSGLAPGFGLSRGFGDAVWSTQVAGDGLIRLVQTSPETPPNIKRVRVVAERFVAQTTADWEKKRNTPSEPERLVDDLFASLQHRLHKAKDAAELTGAQVPTDDPGGQRTELLNRWETQHALFLKQRAQVGEAVAALDRLNHQPQPTSAMVTTERRRQAHEADEALGQDLEELRVKLTQLKAHLLSVWSGAAESLNHLVEAATELVATATLTSVPSVDLPIDPSAETPGKEPGPLGIAARAHQERLVEFVENWDREFTLLKELAIDPQNGNILAVHPRIRKLLNNYLYESAKQLAEIRAAIGQLEATSSDQVRHHVRSSQLVRSFHRLRQARDRFEFGAGGLEMPDNFRLDAATRAARGLRRRTRERTRSIDKRLEARALHEAINKRKADRAKLAERIERLRRDADKTIHDLLMIQITLNDNAASGEQYLRKALEAEVASVRWETIQEQAVGTSERLSELIHRRTSGPAEPPMELVSCEVIAVNVNLSTRLTSSSLAGTAALVLVLVGQLWIARKP